LALTEAELAFACSRPNLHAQAYCFLQIGYFKAKQAFFWFDWNEVEDDCAFVLSRYFHGAAFKLKAITKHEHYTQRERIAELFGYRPWADNFLPLLAQQVAQIVRHDVTPGFVATELVVWLNEHKFIRPGYTTVQELVTETLSAERRRLGYLLAEALDESAKTVLGQLPVRDDTLSQLAALKQDAKNFGWRQMTREREKRITLEPLHGIAKALLPKLPSFAVKLAVLCQLGKLLFRPRPAQSDGEPDATLFDVLCLGTLPAAFRQPGRCDDLPYEAVGG